jgi:hypothetical protein
MRDRTHLLLSYLALALAGVCLTCAELDYLPELALGLPLYLVLVALAWRQGGRRAPLPLWATNLLGLVIAAGAGLWVWARLGNEGTWVEGVPLPGLIVPYLGPVLMALLLVRLFRSSPGDFWLLQGLGLLQVALGCVLANGTVFGLLLLAYVVVGLCALAAHERAAQAWRGAAGGESAAPAAENWSAFGLRWALGVAVLAWPLFLLTPRLDVPDWEPLARFTPVAGNPDAQTGFSDEIDLRREGRLAVDDRVAFRVAVSDRAGQPVRRLPPDQRWRGLVLDRYDKQGVWRCELNVRGAGVPVYRLQATPSEPQGNLLQLRFEVPRRTGALFLADPIHLGTGPGDLTVRPLGPDDLDSPGQRRRHPPLFYEAGGTAVPLTYLVRSEYRYLQHFDPDADPGRTAALRLAEGYQTRLLRCPVAELGPWTVALLRRLAEKPALPELREALAGLDDRPLPPGWSLPPGLWEPAARRLSDHLARSGEYTYSLIQRRETGGIDPVLDFLTNVKEGPCERYAAGLALMLRSVGIPSRIVKGYRGAEERARGHYEVRQSQAHAWVEALVPARQPDSPALEWIVLDPTPQVDSTDSGWARWLQQQQDRAEGVWRDLVLGYGAHQQADLWTELTTGRLLLVPASLALAAGLLLLGRRWRRRRRGRHSRAGGTGLGGLYDRLLEVLAGPLGLRPSPEQTPRELAEAAAGLLRARLEEQSLPAELAGVPGRVVELLYRARWGGLSPAAAEMAEAGRQLDALEQALAAGPSPVVDRA